MQTETDCFKCHRNGMFAVLVISKFISRPGQTLVSFYLLIKVSAQLR